MPRGLNAGSSKSLVDYLSKENSGFFFDKNNVRCTSNHVIEEIDKYGKKGLGKNDDKFYMVTFSPSQYELKQMIGRDNVNDISDMTYSEKKKLYEDLCAFTKNGMDNYAISFNRPNVKSGDDLVYFARIETERAYHHFDKEVKEGKAKSGDKKPGLQFHIHVIVSRKSADNKAKLSPNIRFRNKEFKQGDQKITRGFNYTEFTERCSAKFTEQFNISTRANHNKGGETHSFITKAGYKAQQRLTSTIRSKTTNAILQDSMKTERKIVGNVIKTASTAKTAVAVVTAVNPIIPAAKLVAEALKTIQNIAVKGL